MNYNHNKTYNDCFVYFNIPALFKTTYETEYDLVFESSYAYYSNNIFKKIEKFLEDDFKVRKVKQTINGNKNIINDEVIYTDLKRNIIIGVKYYWDIDEYIEDDSPDDNIIIDSKSKFQAKVKIFTGIQNEEVVNSFFKKVVSKNRKIKRERELNIICSSSEGVFLKAFKTNKIDIDIDKCYNQDFKEVSDEIIRRLSNKKDNGIVLLHSEPGAGKTTYLRYLTHQIQDKRLIYLPPDLVIKLADPDFMSFLMNYPDSILIIEDAETALQKRDVGGNQAVSNLLNNSDGLLGDALKIQVICTFNCDLKLIDPALLRPGRLIAEYKFDKLNIERSNSLLKELYGQDVITNKSLTLAEIYNFEKKKFFSKPIESNIGFNRN